MHMHMLAHARRSAESGIDRRVLLAPAGGACVARHLDIARPAEPLPGRDDAVVARVTRSEEATLDLRWALRGDDARGRSAGHERLAPVRRAAARDETALRARAQLVLRGVKLGRRHGRRRGAAADVVQDAQLELGLALRLRAGVDEALLLLAPHVGRGVQGKGVVARHRTRRVDRGESALDLGVGHARCNPATDCGATLEAVVEIRPHIRPPSSRDPRRRPRARLRRE
eukprot:scaffold1739_cov67-Phaeocystis_antarctica.AAC.2